MTDKEAVMRECKENEDNVYEVSNRVLFGGRRVYIYHNWRYRKSVYLQFDVHGTLVDVF